MISNKFVTQAGKLYELECHVANILWVRKRKRIDYVLLRSLIRDKPNGVRQNDHIAAIIKRYDNEIEWKNGIVNFIYRTRDGHTARD